MCLLAGILILNQSGFCRSNDPIRSGPVRSDPIRSDPVRSDPIRVLPTAPFLGIQLLNRSPQIETKVYAKPTNSGLLLHYQSHVDNRYKKGLLITMLDRTHRLSSSWTHFSDECDRLKRVMTICEPASHANFAFKSKHPFQIALINSC